VHPDFQKHGVASDLMDQFLMNMKAANVKKVYTLVNWRRLRAGELSSPAQIRAFQAHQPGIATALILTDSGNSGRRAFSRMRAAFFFFMWIDCHCHTKHSYDNWLEPLDLIRRARAIGLDGVVITEHHSYEASAPVEAVGREEGLLVLRGVEIATDRGHLLAYGIEDDSWNVWGRDTSGCRSREVIERINDLGGICVPAHPYREFGVCSLLDGLLELQGIAPWRPTTAATSIRTTTSPSPQRATWRCRRWAAATATRSPPWAAARRNSCSR
jgi:hypothetical protein